MPVKWRTSFLEHPTLGRSYVRHWNKLDTKAIIGAISTLPRDTKGYNPPVRMHTLRRGHIEHWLAVRQVHQGITYGEPFEKLLETVSKKTALVEMPVAIIHSLDHTDMQIVTIWKKGTRPFREFLADKTISDEVKQSACLTVMQRMARLHAAGFIHGHLHTKNLVVNARNEPKMVDWTGLREIDENNPTTIDTYRFLQSILLNGPWTPEFKQQLLKKYDAAYAYYTRHQKRNRLQKWVNTIRNAIARQAMKQA